MQSEDKAGQVLGIVELLEYILAELPLSDLLQDIRVCRLWRQVMAKSPKLRRRLHLESIDNGTDASRGIPQDSVGQRQFVPYVLDPAYDLGDPLKLACMSSGILPSCFQYPGASWRNMQLVQPAATTVTLEISYHHVFQCFGYGYDIVNPAGVTLKDYVDALDEIAKFSSKPRFVSLRDLIRGKLEGAELKVMGSSDKGQVMMGDT